MWVYGEGLIVQFFGQSVPQPNFLVSSMEGVLMEVPELLQVLLFQTEELPAPASFLRVGG
jgi:hypothetical protein